MLLRRGRTAHSTNLGQIPCITRGNVRLLQIEEQLAKHFVCTKRAMASTNRIAIRTTFSRFRKAFGATDEYVFGGKIRYDEPYTGTRVDIGRWVTVKTGRFQRRNEFRALTFDASGCTCGPGILVPIDVKTLLQEVRITPMANDRLDVVQELVRCYGLTCPVMKSRLSPARGRIGHMKDDTKSLIIGGCFPSYLTGWFRGVTWHSRMGV